MSSGEFKIPKRQHQATLWVHPIGRVVGALFLHMQSESHAGEEEPVDVLNNAAPFLVLLREDLYEHRFYSKRSIVRVEYDSAIPDESHIVRIECRLHMMDGSLIQGAIAEPLPPEHSRLFDYINMDDGAFLRVYLNNERACLVNKAYIVHIVETSKTPEKPED